MQEEEETNEDSLADENESPERDAWVLDEREEGEEVHSFVLSLLEELMDEATVSTHEAEGVEMSDGTWTRAKDCVSH